MVLRLIFDMPVITSFICIGSFLLSYATYTQYISPTNLYLNYKLAFQDQFQPWRLLTSVLYIGELDLAIIFRLGFLYIIHILSQHMSSFLEQHTFKGSVAHYLYYLIINLSLLFAIGLWMNEHTLSESFIVSLMYLWGRNNSNRPVLLMFVIPIQAQYLTWFFVFINLVYGRSLKSYIIGMSIGHTYYYFSQIVPKLPYFKDFYLFKTPSALVQLFSRFDGNRHLIPDDDFIQ